MRTRPDGLGDEHVAQELGDAWGLRVEHIEHAPVGFGSHHWRATAGGRRWFVTVDDLAVKRREGAEPLDGPRRRLSAALSTARSLADAGLGFVVAPQPTAAGTVLHPVGERFAVALYPHVEGEAHEPSAYPTPAERLAVLDLLADLHRTPASAALVDDLAVPQRHGLVTALGQLHGPWRTGPCGEPARALLAEHAGDVVGALARYDTLAAAVAARPGRMVVTHGEPHRGNTITSVDGGTVLVDWDTALVAPPERDLWALADEDPHVVDEYESRTGHRPDADALACYRSWWSLTEVSLCTAVFRAHHADDEDVRLHWSLLGRHLPLLTA